jgi:predicted deacetylase
MPAKGRLFASVHDVAPCFEREVDCLLDVLQPHVGGRLALLVVPNHWKQAPIVPGSPFASKLRGWAGAGFEIFLHGFYHRDETPHRTVRNRAYATLMTASEGEFLGLDRTEADERIRHGRTLLEDITGQPIAGFVAPAWLYGAGVIEALTNSGMPMAEDHFRVWSPASGEVLSRSPVITWASRSRARRISSILVAGALRRVPFRDLRIGVHPGDCRSPLLLDSIKKTFRVAAARRRPARYSDLLIRSAS